MRVDFAREPLDAEVWGEARPLLESHWREVAHYDDIELAPDFHAYATTEAAGVLRFFTVRADSVLQGYALFFVRNNPHYCGSLQASADVLYLDPKIRGRSGWSFMRWCDEQLRDEGVQVVYQRTKARPDLNFAPILERMGYDLVDLVYAKRLDTVVEETVDGGRSGDHRHRGGRGGSGAPEPAVAEGQG